MPDQLTREFNLELFEREILDCTDVPELQNIAIKLRSQLHSQQMIYEALLTEALADKKAAIFPVAAE